VHTQLLSLFFYFFFQAEDGIRDPLVTGVQTCALPISADRESVPFRGWHRRNGTDSRSAARGDRDPGPLCPRSGGAKARPVFWQRSEERRVGKRCKSQGRTGQEQDG